MGANPSGVRHIKRLKRRKRLEARLASTRHSAADKPRPGRTPLATVATDKAK
jgi:hypothetical protein